MGKLTKAQISVLRQVAARDGHFSAWALGTRTCEALRTRGLVRNSYGDKAFTTHGGLYRDGGHVYITPAGRAALSDTTDKEG